METTERAVTRLTTTHTEYEGGRAVERAPLLFELSECASAQDGRGSGSGGAGIPINLAVIALQDRISGKLKQMREALNLPPRAGVLESTAEVWACAKVERSGGRIDDHAWERFEAEFPDWVRRITEEVSPPASTEIITPCPECGETRAFLRGDTVTAVVVKWYPDELDRAPVAKCRFCDHQWVGWGAMKFNLGAVNEDVLSTLGIDVNAFVA
ncbi:hypothetical protein ICM05_01135 [Leucobacter sp. cx-42]|uniref:hypothetical protein n=1 Tax=unclassified Leucobacter TaxID=2621730 RepID=UPI00165E91DD|nr:MULTISPECIES: hypothetical protein [unclassified Leucobacter]MBC9953252.1 hypothetical protein [Leucobacter sp. cx-42]